MPHPRPPVADDTIAMQLDALYAVDDAIRARKDELRGTGHVRCPSCKKNALAYAFERRTAGSRKLTFTAVCETYNCPVKMRGDG